LDTEERRTIKRLISVLKLDLNIDDDDREFQRQFDICRGEYLSGNDSPQLKATLKRYILQAIQENKIPRNEGMTLLFNLSL